MLAQKCTIDQLSFLRLQMKILKTVSQNMPNMHSNLVLRYTSECCLSFYDRISIIFSPLDFCRHFLSLMTYPPNEFLSSFWKKVSSGISVSLYHSASQLLTMGKMPKKVSLDENQSLANSKLTIITVLDYLIQAQKVVFSKRQQIAHFCLLCISSNRGLL